MPKFFFQYLAFVSNTLPTTTGNCATTAKQFYKTFWLFWELQGDSAFLNNSQMNFQDFFPLNKLTVKERNRGDDFFRHGSQSQSELSHSLYREEFVVYH